MNRGRPISTSQLTKLIPKSVGEAFFASKTPEKDQQTFFSRSFSSLNDENSRKIEPRKSPIAYKERSEINRLQAELKLSKLNEESLRNDLNVTLIHCILISTSNLILALDENTADQSINSQHRQEK